MGFCCVGGGAQGGELVDGSRCTLAHSWVPNMFFGELANVDQLCGLSRGQETEGSAR
jgi:hypothetical protein